MERILPYRLTALLLLIPARQSSPVPQPPFQRSTLRSPAPSRSPVTSLATMDSVCSVSSPQSFFLTYSSLLSLHYHI